MRFQGRIRGVVAGNITLMALLAIVGLLVAVVAIPLYLATPWSNSAGHGSAPAGAASQSALRTAGTVQPPADTSSPHDTPSPAATPSPHATPSPTQTARAVESAVESPGPTTPVAVTVPPTQPVASAAAPTSTPIAVKPTAGPMTIACVFGIGDAGVAVQTSQTATPGGTGWLWVGHANCPTAHVDPLQITFPSGETITAGAPALLGVDLKWTFSVPADAGVGQAVLRLPGSGIDIDGVSHSDVIVVYLQIVAP